MMLLVIITVVLFTACEAGTNAAGSYGLDPDRPVERFEFESGEQLEELAESLNYTPEAWQAGIREVPRMYITNIPPRWAHSKSKELPVLAKKQAFFRLLGPLILHSNEQIRADRLRLEKILDSMRAGDQPGPADETFLRETAAAYRLADGLAAANLDDEFWKELMMRVDTLPPSLVLAQAAEESGWGTSRFAVEGNALFGVWTWGDKGITPKQQRSEHGDHKVASYDTPMESVAAYMRNLNTHPAYAGLRSRRAELRRSGEKVSGWELAKTLTRYSERGQAYVESLHGLMKTNMLMATDDAYLGDGPTILLIPVGEGS